MKLRGKYKGNNKVLPKQITTFTLLQEAIKKTFPQYKQDEVSLYYLRDQSIVELEEEEDFYEMIQSEQQKITIFLRDAEEMKKMKAVNNVENEAPEKNETQNQDQHQYQQRQRQQYQEKLSDQNQKQNRNTDQKQKQEPQKIIQKDIIYPPTQIQNQAINLNLKQQNDEQKSSSQHKIQCKQCQKPISAPLYKCLNCHDYELCLTCIKKHSHHKGHYLTKIEDQLTWKRVNYHTVINKLFNPNPKQEKQNFQFWIDSEDILNNNPSFKKEMANQSAKISQLIASNIDQWLKEYNQTTQTN